jgi:hypothetical protein
MSGIDRIGLILVDYAGDSFHVDGDVDPHSRSGMGVAAGSQGMCMRTATVFLMALAATGCTARTDRAPDSPLEQGRLYTSWLYGSQFQKLWDRFSPDMRQTFGTVGELANFAGRAVTRLGREKGAVDEQVSDAEAVRVYRRRASFDAGNRQMLIEWSLAKDGAVTGLVVRPVPGDSI